MSHQGSSHHSTRSARRVLGTAATLLSALTVSGHSLAQNATGSEGTQWGLGLAAGVFQRPYAGADNKNRALPLLYVENRWLRIAGPSADLKLGTLQGGYGALAFTGRLKYDGIGYDADDSPQLAGMDERKKSFWAGGAVSWNTAIARTSLEWLGDASGNSKGQQLQLQVDRRFGFGALSITPRAQAQWLDKKYVDYYYGVKAHEATAGRAQYSGKSALTYSLGARMDYQIQSRHSVFLDVSATRLPDEIKNSPIVDRSSVARASVGYMYRF